MGDIKIVKDEWNMKLHILAVCPYCDSGNKIEDDEFEKFGIMEGCEVDHLIECVWCDEVFRLKVDEWSVK